MDGPHGVFSIDQYEGAGFCLIAGGVGIAPAMSMLETLADRGDVRPVVLFAGNRNWDKDHPARPHRGALRHISPSSSRAGASRAS